MGLQGYLVVALTAAFTLVVGGDVWAMSRALKRYRAGLSSGSACTHYASATAAGTESGTSSSEPFRPVDFWAVASAGDVLCLLDGTYSGDHFMLVPPPGLSGLEGNPITIRALHDGAVRIDGEDARAVVRIENSAWWVLEGFDATNGGGIALGNGTVDLQNSDHIIVRRVVAYNTTEPGTSGVVPFAVRGGSDHNLLEDVAGFGWGRKIYLVHQDDGSNTWRRAWGAWEGTKTLGPKMTFTYHYNSGLGNLGENNIGTWTGERGCTTTEEPSCSQIYGIHALDRNDKAPIGIRLYGVIAYLRPGARLFTGFSNALISVRMGATATSGNVVQDAVAYQAGSEYDSIEDLQLENGPDATGSSAATSITSIGGNDRGFKGSDWTLTNLHWNYTLGASPSIYLGSGAKVCYRYVDGVLTRTPLWPWPMDARIKSARAAAGSSSVTAGMPRDDGLVTSAIEQIFGAIPSACRNGGGER